MHFPQLCVFADAGQDSAGLAPQLQAALLGMLGKPVHEFVHVDVGEKLAALGLDKFFPVEAWPPQNAVRELATRLKSRSKHGEKNVFLAVDLHKFLPNFCPDFAPVTCQSAEPAESRASKAFQRKLELPAWLMAWEGYSLAASVLGQVDILHELCLMSISVCVGMCIR